MCFHRFFFMSTESLSYLARCEKRFVSTTCIKVYFVVMKVRPATRPICTSLIFHFYFLNSIRYLAVKNSLVPVALIQPDFGLTAVKPARMPMGTSHVCFSHIPLIFKSFLLVHCCCWLCVEKQNVISSVNRARNCLVQNGFSIFNGYILNTQWLKARIN